MTDLSDADLDALETPDMTVTKEMIEAGRGRLDACSAYDTDSALVEAIYLAMREKDPEFARLRFDVDDLCDTTNANLDSYLSAHAALAEAVEVLRPFAELSDMACAKAPIDVQDTALAILSTRFSDLRAARAFVEKHGGKNDG